MHMKNYKYKTTQHLQIDAGGQEQFGSVPKHTHMHLNFSTVISLI